MTSSTRRDASAVVRRLASGLGGDDRLTHLEVLPPRPGTRVAWPDWTAPELVAAWQARGITAPWSHQVQAAEAARRGEHVVLSTGTASG